MTTNCCGESPHVYTENYVVTENVQYLVALLCVHCVLRSVILRCPHRKAELTRSCSILVDVFHKTESWCLAAYCVPSRATPQRTFSFFSNCFWENISLQESNPRLSVVWEAITLSTRLCRHVQKCKLIHTCAFEHISMIQILRIKSGTESHLIFVYSAFVPFFLVELYYSTTWVLHCTVKYWSRWSLWYGEVTNVDAVHQESNIYVECLTLKFNWWLWIQKEMHVRGSENYDIGVRVTKRRRTVRSLTDRNDDKNKGHQGVEDWHSMVVSNIHERGRHW